MRNFMKTMSGKMNEILEVKPLVKSLEDSVNMMSDKYDELLKEMKESRKRVNELEKKVEELRTESKTKDECIKDLQIRLQESEQYARNRNIEISGIEQRKNENLREVMHSIASKLNIHLEDSDIDIIHRVPTRNERYPPKIIVQFVTRTKRNVWLSKKKNRLMSSDILEARGKVNSAVYINEHLTAHCQRLLWIAKQEGKKKGYKFIWCREGKVFLKKEDSDATVIRVVSEEEVYQKIV